MVIGCCKDCKERKVTESYNCHDHCERYLAETKERENEKQKIRKVRDQIKLSDAVAIEGHKRRKRGKR